MHTTSLFYRHFNFFNQQPRFYNHKTNIRYNKYKPWERCIVKLELFYYYSSNREYNPLIIILGQRAQDFRHKTDSVDERHPRYSIHKSEIGRQSGSEVTAEISVASESASSVRLDTGRAQDGPRNVQKSAQFAGVGVRRRWHSRLGIECHRSNWHISCTCGRCAPTGHRKWPGEGAGLGRCKYYCASHHSRSIPANQRRLIHTGIHGRADFENFNQHQ